MLNELLCGGMHSVLPQWLPKVDRLYFAQGIPFFSPFLDRDVIRTAFRIPSAYKIRRWQEKYILRLSDEALVSQTTSGFPKQFTFRELPYSEAMPVVERL